MNETELEALKIFIKVRTNVTQMVIPQSNKGGHKALCATLWNSIYTHHKY